MNFLIVGLGNIGAEYANTRHNIGFMVLDALAKASNLVFEDRRYGAVATLKVKNQTLIRSFSFSQSGLQEKPTDYGVQRLYIIAADKQDLKSPSGRMNARPVIWLAVLPGKNLLKVIFA